VEGGTTPELQVVGPLTQTADLDLTLDVIAQCGSDSLVYSVDAGTLAPREIAAVDLPELAKVEQWTWIAYGAPLFVRVSLVDPKTGTPRAVTVAPDRWLGWDGKVLSLALPEDRETTVAARDADHLAETETEGPPVVVATWEVK